MVKSSAVPTLAAVSREYLTCAFKPLSNGLFKPINVEEYPNSVKLRSCTGLGVDNLKRVRRELVKNAARVVEELECLIASVDELRYDLEVLDAVDLARSCLLPLLYKDHPWVDLKSHTRDVQGQRRRRGDRKGRRHNGNQSSAERRREHDKMTEVWGSQELS